MNDDTQVTGNDAPADADTVDTQENSADVQTNNEAPEATQEVKETAEKAEDTADEKLYAGKYKSPEDLEKGYTELQSKFGKETSEKAELSRILNEAFAAPVEQQPGDGSEFEEDSPQDDRLERIERQSAVQGFILNHPDANPAEMQKILSEDPMLKQIQGHDAKLEYAYLKSQNIASPKAIEEAQKTAASQAQSKLVEKQAAQVETAKKAEEDDAGSDLFSKATGNYSAEDRAAARKELIRKHLTRL